MTRAPQYDLPGTESAFNLMGETMTQGERATWAQQIEADREKARQQAARDNPELFS